MCCDVFVCLSIILEILSQIKIPCPFSRIYHPISVCDSLVYQLLFYDNQCYWGEKTFFFAIHLSRKRNYLLLLLLHFLIKTSSIGVTAIAIVHVSKHVKNQMNFPPFQIVSFFPQHFLNFFVPRYFRFYNWLQNNYCLLWCFVLFTVKARLLIPLEHYFVHWNCYHLHHQNYRLQMAY